MVFAANCSKSRTQPIVNSQVSMHYFVDPIGIASHGIGRCDRGVEHFDTNSPRCFGPRRQVLTAWPEQASGGGPPGIAARIKTDNNSQTRAWCLPTCASAPPTGYRGQWD